MILLMARIPSSSTVYKLLLVRRGYITSSLQDIAMIGIKDGLINICKLLNNTVYRGVHLHRRRVDMSMS
jgi:hypothetical protein